MRILLLGPYPPPHGGVQTNLVAIRDYLRKRGIACAVVNLTRHRRPDAGDVYYPKNAAGVLKLLLRLRYDIVHFHLGGSVTPRLLGLSFLCCLLPRRKAVLTFHSGGYPSSPEGRTARPRTLRGFVFRRFDRVIGVNREIVEMFRRFGLSNGRLRLIPPHSLPAAAESALPERLATFFESHRPVLLTVGLLEPEYDLPLQIDALARVRDRFQEAGLAIIGSGSLEAELKRRIETEPHVLLCGDVPHAATLAAIARCDVFLRTTLYDGDSVSVREALHLGARVVATDNSMRPEGVRLIPPRDLAALVDAIEKSLCAPRGAPAREDENNLQAVLDVYRELMVD